MLKMKQGIKNPNLDPLKDARITILLISIL